MIKNITRFVVGGLLAMSAATTLTAFAGDNDDDAPNDALTIDRTVIGASEIAFPNDDRIYPKVSDFEVLNFVLMSSINGERWATVTLKNKASGSRKLQPDHIMALFANGERKSPGHVKRTFDGNETVSFPLSFGHSKFPVLSIYTRK